MLYVYTYAYNCARMHQCRCERYGGIYLYARNDRIILVVATYEKNRRDARANIFERKPKNSINLSAHSCSRDIRRVLSWRYALCDRRKVC